MLTIFVEKCNVLFFCKKCRPKRCPKEVPKVCEDTIENMDEENGRGRKMTKNLFNNKNTSNSLFYIIFQV